MNDRFQEGFILNPSWSFIGQLFIGIVAVCLALTVVIAIAQPLGLLDGLRDKVKQQQELTKPRAPSPYSAPIGE